MIFKLTNTEKLSARQLLCLFAEISRRLSPTAHFSPFGSHSQQFLEALQHVDDYDLLTEISDVVDESWGDADNRYRECAKQIDAGAADPGDETKLYLDAPIDAFSKPEEGWFMLYCLANHKTRRALLKFDVRSKSDCMIYVECSSAADSKIDWQVRLTEHLSELRRFAKGLIWVACPDDQPSLDELAARITGVGSWK